MVPRDQYPRVYELDIGVSPSGLLVLKQVDFLSYPLSLL